MESNNIKNSWTLEKSRAIYGIGERASELDYLDISENGDLIIKLENETLSIPKITKKIKKCGYSSFVLRIPELIHRQMEKLYSSFHKAIELNKYSGFYRGVFPVKVNQTYTAIKSIHQYGKDFNHGFEVGTKPELLLAVSQINQISTPIICNGTKDRDYIEACLVLQKIGYNIIISIESIHEINIVLDLIAIYNIIPSLGLRIKLLQQVEGHWGHSSGLYSKFGFSGNNLKTAISLLQQKDLLNAITLVHGHVGSQIGDKKYFELATAEVMGIYKNLRELGAENLEFVNLGGGLGIDYVGNQKNHDSGVSYSFFEYALVIVESIKKSLEKFPDIPEPNIITESGRAISAHYSMLFIDILETREPKISTLTFTNNELDKIYTNYLERLEKLSSIDSLTELVNFTEKCLKKTTSNLNFWLNEEVREEIENFKLFISRSIRKTIQNLISNDQKVQMNDLAKKLLNRNFSDYLINSENQLVGNFSVFNGACDSILVDQYFPIIPTEHLDEKPYTLAKIIDITCDSDGELVSYKTSSKDRNLEWNFNDFFTVDYHLMKVKDDSLKLHGIPLPKSIIEPNKYLVVGLTGAYQSTVYFDQNLLGRLTEIALTFNDILQKYELTLLRPAESSIDLLPKMNYKTEQIINKLPYNPIFQSLLFSSPYIDSDIQKTRLDELFNELPNVVTMSEEPIISIISEDDFINS